MRAYSPFSSSSQPKKFRSLQQTLAFLQSMNRGQPFESEQMEITSEPKAVRQEQPPTQPKRPVPVRAANVDLEGADRKRLNKNRAIKRIMLSSLEFLEGSYQKSQEQTMGSSSTTEFQIYLKQYNRLLERILNLEKQGTTKARENTEKQEEILENIYNFTVIEDFKDIIQCAILKDRISKETVQRMMEVFSRVLVVIKGNQLRVYENTDQDSRFRTIKLFEIENVDYHTEPYIFTVLTVVKDKSKQSQFLYLKFGTRAHQNKWDRAIYCNQMLRKMKHKDKLFELEYPPEKMETKLNVGGSYEKQEKALYELNRRDILKKISMEDSYSALAAQNQGGMIELPRGEDYNEFSSGSPLADKRLAQPGVSINSNSSNKGISPSNKLNQQTSELSEQHAHENSSNNPSEPMSMISGVAGLMDRGREKDSQIASPTKPGTIIKDKPLVINDDALLGGVRLKKEKSQNGEIDSLLQSERKDRKSTGDKENSVKPVIGNQNRNYSVYGNIRNLTGKETMSEVIESKQDLSQKSHIQSARKKEIESKHKSGIQMKKQKFLFDKSKLITLGEGEIQYWDYDETTKNKSQQKSIKISSITKSQIKEKSIEIIHENGKSISLIANLQTIKQLEEWIDLQRKSIVQRSRLKEESVIHSEILDTNLLQPK